MFEDPALTFAARLKRSYKAGQHSRLQGLSRVPPYDDYDLCLAWVCGYDAVQAEIDELNEDDSTHPRTRICASRSAGSTTGSARRLGRSRTRS
jgi:hypothetical protein